MWMTALDRREDRRWRTTPSWIDVSIDEDLLAETSGYTVAEATARLHTAIRQTYPETKLSIEVHRGRLSHWHNIESNARVPFEYDVCETVRAALGNPW